MASHRPRFYIPSLIPSEPADTENGLSPNMLVPLDKPQKHHLKKVLRDTRSEIEIIINRPDGFWLATKKSKGTRSDYFLTRFIKENTEPPFSFILLFPVTKNSRLSFIFEKGTELGVTDFMPLRYDYTQGTLCKSFTHRTERYKNILVSAACQSRRNRVPKIHPVQTIYTVFKKSLAHRKGASFTLFHPDGRSSILNQKTFQSPDKYPRAVIIGPEGGFSKSELTEVTMWPDVHQVSLGARILRLETAVISALTLVGL